ncbi:MAG: creatininase family protein [Pseudomonadota bacterium]
MRLDLCTWPEIESYLQTHDGIILPTGSTEQHGPIGLIGTDTLCAQDIAVEAGAIARAMVAPVVAYTPAAFNMGFPGTLSLSVETFSSVIEEIVDGLIHHGFGHIYVLNGHGANIEPIKRIAAGKRAKFRLQSWWDFAAVNALRQRFYGEWEGMHATPSEIAMTQARYRVVEGKALKPPKKLSAEFIKAHAGDRHGGPEEHRARFPDGRVGSHSSLATPEQGADLFAAASIAVAEDYEAFVEDRQ